MTTGTPMTWPEDTDTPPAGAALFADLCTERLSDRSPVPFTSAAAAAAGL